MAIAIISDSHDNTQIVGEVLTRLDKIKPSHIFHCGDITTPDTLKLFAGRNMHFVLGNCDVHQRDVLNKAALEVGFSQIGRELEVTIEEKRFYMHHGDKEIIIDEMSGAQLYDYVLHGHTHLKRNEVLGRTRIVCPGALYRAERYSYAILDHINDKIEFFEL